MMLAPLVSFDAIDKDELNRCLVEWRHKMGPFNRPDYGGARFHGLRHDGALVAVTATDQLIANETCGLGRHEAFELARVCAARPDLCRAVLRLWREFIFPALVEAKRGDWAISYQCATEHTGDLYRLDGWVRLGATWSGTDERALEGARSGRKKIVWGWHADAAERLNIREWGKAVDWPSWSGPRA